MITGLLGFTIYHLLGWFFGHFLWGFVAATIYFVKGHIDACNPQGTAGGLARGLALLFFVVCTGIPGLIVSFLLPTTPPAIFAPSKPRPVVRPGEAASSGDW